MTSDVFCRYWDLLPVDSFHRFFFILREGSLLPMPVHPKMAAKKARNYLSFHLKHLSESGFQVKEVILGASGSGLMVNNV